MGRKNRGDKVKKGRKNENIENVENSESRQTSSKSRLNKNDEILRKTICSIRTGFV